MCLGFSAFSALADSSVSFSTEYFNDTKVLALSGTTSGSLNDMAIALIYNYVPGVGINETSPILADSFLLGTDGVIDYDIILPESLAGGKYVIRIATDGGYLDKSFMHTNDSLAPAALAVINSASKDSFLQVLAEQGPACGLDPDIYDEYKAQISPILYSYKPQGGFKSVDSFIKLSNQAIAATLINNGEAVASVLETYGTYLTELSENEEIIIDCVADYNLLNDTVKTDLSGRLINTSFADSKGFCRVFRELAIFTQYENALNWAGIKDVILGTENEKVISNNFDIISPDTEYYDDLKDKDEVFRNMYRDRTEVSSFEDISEFFYEVSEECYDLESESSKKSSGGGGGGGSSSGKISLQTSGVATVTPAIIAGENTSVSFSDTTGHWGEEAISTLVRKNVLSGYADGTFKPDANVTRAEFVTMVVKAFSVNGDEVIEFTDLTSSSWAFPYVKKAVASGVITGYADGSFKPDEFISREQAAVILHRVLSLKLTLPEGSSDFVDVADISEYALRSVLDLAGKGLIHGVGDKIFMPHGNSTRAMAATMINNAVEFVGAQ